MRSQAEDAAEERVLDALLPGPRAYGPETETETPESTTRQRFRKMLREGELDDKEIEIELEAASIGVEIMAPAGHGGDDEPASGNGSRTSVPDASGRGAFASVRR